MTKTLIRITLCSMALITQLACQSNKVIEDTEGLGELLLMTADIKNLVAIADCTGPNLSYVTEVHSSADGYVYFKQSYENDDNYEVVILNDSIGFELAENQKRAGMLTKEVMAIIRGHEFHKIHLQPTTYYSNITFVKEELYRDQNCEVYAAVDEMENKVLLYYNKQEKRLEALKVKNPLDTTQQIEVIYKEWMTKKIGSVAKQVEIIQGETEIYTFDFREVKINDSNFLKKSVH